MSTDLDLVNAALAHIAQPALLHGLDNTTNSHVAGQANMFLPMAKKESLRARDWNCVRGRKELAVVANESLGEWTQAYRLPVDCLAVRRFVSPYDRLRSAKFKVEIDSQKKPILYTTHGTNKIVYTRNITDVNQWDDLLFGACAIRLAWYLAGPLTKDFKIQQMQLQTLSAMFDEACGVNEGEGGIETPRDRTLVSVRF